MNKKIYFPVFIVAALAGLFLAACGAVPAGAEVDINPDGQSALVEFTGTVESIGADQWLISGQTVLVGVQTVVEPGIAVGDLVEVKANVTLDGRATAERIERSSSDPAGTDEPDLSLTETPEAGDGTEFVGVVESIGPDSWTVSGRLFLVNAQTEIKGVIAVGDTVKVHAGPDGSGALVAREIERSDGRDDFSSADPGVEMEFTGVVQVFSPDAITVGGRVFAITSSTEIKGTIAVGDTVKVHAFGNLDGSLTAREVEKTDVLIGSGGDDGSALTEGTDDHGGAATESTDDHGGTAEPESTDDHGGNSGNG